jgi:hypothetical protein
MARENYVVCNRCSKRVKPPENAGFVTLMVFGPDGINWVDSLGDLCGDCRVGLMQFVNALPKQIEVVQ